MASKVALRSAGATASKSSTGWEYRPIWARDSHAMNPLPRLFVLDQTVAHLREGVRARRWGTELPGVLRLAQELDVSKDAVRAALLQLESEGLLLPAGHGKK